MCMLWFQVLLLACVACLVFCCLHVLHVSSLVVCSAFVCSSLFLFKFELTFFSIRINPLRKRKPLKKKVSPVPSSEKEEGFWKKTHGFLVLLQMGARLRVVEPI